MSSGIDIEAVCRLVTNFAVRDGLHGTNIRMIVHKNTEDTNLYTTTIYSKHDDVERRAMECLKVKCRLLEYMLQNDLGNKHIRIHSTDMPYSKFMQHCSIDRMSSSYGVIFVTDTGLGESAVCSTHYPLHPD